MLHFVKEKWQEKNKVAANSSSKVTGFIAWYLIIIVGLLN
jgi:hypothetical protein